MRLLPTLVALILPAIAEAQFAPRPRVPAPTVPPPFVGSVGPVAPGPYREMRDVRERIADSRDAGQLSRREARRLRRQATYVETLADRYARDGLSEAEQRELAVRSQVLRDETIARRSGARR